MAAKRTPELIVCTNGGCRRARGHGKLLDLAATVPGSATVPCQGICDGPVVGLRDDRGIRWYRRFRGPARRALEQILHDGGSPSRLRKQEVRKRRGVLRHARRLQPLR